MLGKSICTGYMHSFCKSGNMRNCPFCKAGGINIGQTDEETVQKMMKRVEANNAGAIYLLANYYSNGHGGLQRDEEKAMELRKHATELGFSQAHNYLGAFYKADNGDLKKAKFHYETAAMTGDEMTRCQLGNWEAEAGNMERAVKHWTIAASCGQYNAMQHLIKCVEYGLAENQSTQL